jgi:hypothetical protein
MSEDYFEPINWGNKKNKKKTANKKNFRGIMSDFGYGGDVFVSQPVFVDDFFDNSYNLVRNDLVRNAEIQRLQEEANYAAQLEAQRQADAEAERERQAAAQRSAARAAAAQAAADAAAAAAARASAADKAAADAKAAAAQAAADRAAAVAAAAEKKAALEKDAALTQLKNSLLGIDLSGLDFKIDFGNLGNVGASDLLGIDRRLNDAIATKVEAERVAAEKEAARVEAARVAAEKEAARVEAARVAAEKEAARVEAARVAAEKEAARVEAARVEAERVAAKKAAAEKAAAQAAADKAYAEKYAAELLEAKRKYDEKVAADKAAEEKALKEAKEARDKFIAEKAAADKEAARLAAEQEAERIANQIAAAKAAAESKRIGEERKTALAKIDRKISQKTSVTTNKKYNLAISLDNTANPIYGTTIPSAIVCPQGYSSVPVLSLCALDANWVFTVTATTKDKAVVKSDTEVMVKFVYTDTDTKKKYQLDVPILVAKGKNSGSNTYKLGIVYPTILSIAVSKIGPPKKTGFIGFNDNNESSIDTFMGKETVKKLSYDGEATLTQLPDEQQSEVVMTKTTLTKNLAPLVILLGAVATFFILKKIIKDAK